MSFGLVELGPNRKSAGPMLLADGRTRSYVHRVDPSTIQGKFMVGYQGW